MSVAEVIDNTKIIDVDSHVTEPPDLWTSRVSVAKWGDLVPHVRWDDQWQEERWFVGDQSFIGVGVGAMAGWKDLVPSQPPTMDDTDPDPGIRWCALPGWTSTGSGVRPFTRTSLAFTGTPSWV